MSSKIIIKEYSDKGLERVLYLDKGEVVGVLGLDGLIEEKGQVIKNLKKPMDYVMGILPEGYNLSDSSKNITSKVEQDNLQEILGYKILIELGYRTLIQPKYGRKILTRASVSALDKAMTECKRDAEISIYYTIKKEGIMVFGEVIRCANSYLQ